ncbi:hypothetical protein FHX42_005292 [Saccharopolyspora lacisalsi]|uniref:Uncharacterized protein n=1 Tax=Halosaccharopolyspora lacisalsi TaxID=1000566 RepID=A0A839E7J5_9PSEU|nr:hypothetical protein [Halosaccharopolyspora lacisalsi]MBA8827885.1 hypothetical protein [Halosaccharopolyspora lacisalsi]
MTVQRVRAETVNPDTDQFVHATGRDMFRFPINWVDTNRRDGSVLIDFGNPRDPSLNAWCASGDAPVYVDRTAPDDTTEESQS